MVILLVFERDVLWTKDGNLHVEISGVCSYYEAMTIRTQDECLAMEGRDLQL